MRRIGAIVLAVIVAGSLLGSASVANADPHATTAFNGASASEQLDPGDPGLPPDP